VDLVANPLEQLPETRLIPWPRRLTTRRWRQNRWLHWRGLTRPWTPQAIPKCGGAALTEMAPSLKVYFFAADTAWTYERACEPALPLGDL